MDLILWRHAEAEDGGDDLARRLTAKGQKQAERMGEWLDRHLPAAARVLVSPAVRAQQTAHALARKARTVDAIGPGASASEVLRAAGWPDAHDAVVVVGHQPTLGAVASLVLAGEEAGWSVKKGAIWWLSDRDRSGGRSVVLRAVIGPELV